MTVRVDIVHGSKTRASEAIVLCSFFFDGTTVTCTNETFLKLARTMGVIGTDGKTCFPSDGMTFMEALPKLYRGPHLKATEPRTV